MKSQDFAKRPFQAVVGKSAERHSWSLLTPRSVDARTCWSIGNQAVTPADGQSRLW